MRPTGWEGARTNLLENAVGVNDPDRLKKDRYDGNN